MNKKCKETSLSGGGIMKNKRTVGQIGKILALTLGFCLFGWAIGFNSIWFRILIGTWGFLIVVNVFLSK
jgi:hypothetical protein